MRGGSIPRGGFVYTSFVFAVDWTAFKRVRCLACLGVETFDAACLSERGSVPTPARPVIDRITRGLKDSPPKQRGHNDTRQAVSRISAGSQTRRAASRCAASRRVASRARINQKYEMRPAEFRYIYGGGQFNDTHFPVARNSQYFHQKHTYNSRLR